MLARELTETVSALAQRLFAIDGDPDVLFVRSQTGGRTRTAAEAREVVAALDHAWLEYGVLADAVQQPDAAPDVTRLQTQLDEIATRAARLAGDSREAVRRLDAAEASVGELVTRTRLLGQPGRAPEAEAAAALEKWKAAVTADPAFADASGYAERIDASRIRVDELERQWRELPEQRRAAGELLAAIELVVTEGGEAFRRARQKIVLQDRHLLEPLHPSSVDILRSSLAGIEHEADSGAWDTAAERLVAWRRQANDAMATARRVVDMNSSPVRHRDELRGRIDGYRSMAVLTGRAEDPTLTRLHAEACEELYSEPCDLKGAERLVQAYIAALHDGA